MLDFLMEYLRPGPLGGISILVGGAWYIYRIVVTRQVVPNKTSWGIWAVLTSVIALCFGLTEPGDIKWIAYAMLIEIVLVALLSITYGVTYNRDDPEDEKDRLRDKRCLQWTFATLVFWPVCAMVIGLDSAKIVLVLELVICAYAAWPTIQKAWKHPELEGRGPWFFTLLGHLLGLLAVIMAPERTLEAWAYAIGALCFIDGPIAVVLLIRPDQSLAPGQTKLYPGLRGLIRV